MTDDPDSTPAIEPTYEQLVARRLRQEQEELDYPRARAQAVIDHWWGSQRELEAEIDDTYMVGGFMERHSRTPSFHKSRRDRDWRTK